MKGGLRGQRRQLWTERGMYLEERARKGQRGESLPLLEVGGWVPHRGLPFSLHPQALGILVGREESFWSLTEPVLCSPGLDKDTLTRKKCFGPLWVAVLIPPTSPSQSSVGLCCAHTHIHTTLLLGCRFHCSSELLRHDQGGQEESLVHRLGNQASLRLSGQVGKCPFKPLLSISQLQAPPGP